MFLVIDGSALLTTHYYGSIPPQLKSSKGDEDQNLYHLIKQNKDGIFVNGVESTLYSILELLETNKVNHIAICFDQSRETFRKTMYDNYKGNRKTKPFPLKQQFETLQTILKDIGIPTFVSSVYEADDLAGSIINEFKNPFDSTYFITKDHDWFQLVDDLNNVKGIIISSSKEKAIDLRSKYDMVDENSFFNSKGFILLPKMVCYNEFAVKDSDGVDPKQIPDKKGFAGDTADNIPGILGIGDKTAIALLSRYKTMEDFYEDVHKKDLQQLTKELKSIHIGESSTTKLFNNEKDAMLSKELAIISTDCNEIPKDFKSYAYHIDKKILLEYIKNYNLTTLMRFTHE